MNNEAPASTAALQARIADLEQQLKLSDEGVSRLAERCLGLEQEVQSYLAAHPQNEKHTDSPALLHHSHNFSFHNALAYFSFLLQFILRLNKNLQTVKLKYMLIVLVFTSRLLATFVVEFLLCREEARGPRRRNDGSEKTSTASGPRWSQLTVQRYGNLSCPTKF